MFQHFDLTGATTGEAISLDDEVVSGLKVEPETIARAEKASEPDGGIRRNRPLPRDDLRC